MVVAADSGVAHALALGLAVDVAVGDFDSLDPRVLEAVEAAGTRVERHPAAKDATDLELAIDVAVGLGAARIVVLGGHGGRLDHFLANALVLAAPQLARRRGRGAGGRRRRVGGAPRARAPLRRPGR